MLPPEKVSPLHAISCFLPVSPFIIQTSALTHTHIQQTHSLTHSSPLHTFTGWWSASRTKPSFKNCVFALENAVKKETALQRKGEVGVGGIECLLDLGYHDVEKSQMIDSTSASALQGSG